MHENTELILSRDCVAIQIPSGVEVTLPAGTNVVTWPGTNHWLPELWTDPLKFDPERFTEPRCEHKQHEVFS